MKKAKCDDKNCIVHKNILPRGRTFTGTVISSKMQKTASVEWHWKRKIPKYERFEIKTTKVKAHNSQCINAQKGDKVVIQECRPLSKTKNFVITKILGKDIEFLEKEEAIGESKTRKMCVKEGLTTSLVKQKVSLEKKEVIEEDETKQEKKEKEQESKK